MNNIKSNGFSLVELLIAAGIGTFTILSGSAILQIQNTQTKITGEAGDSLLGSNLPIRRIMLDISTARSLQANGSALRLLYLVQEGTVIEPRELEYEMTTCPLNGRTVPCLIRRNLSSGGEVKFYNFEDMRWCLYNAIDPALADCAGNGVNLATSMSIPNTNSARRFLLEYDIKGLSRDDSKQASINTLNLIINLDNLDHNSVERDNLILLK